MLNDILHRKQLGATTARSSYTGRSGSSSSSSTSNTSSTSSTNTSSTNISTTGDPYAQYITYQNGVPSVVISDGTYSFTLPLEEFTSRGNKKYTVREALHNFLGGNSLYEEFVANAQNKTDPFWNNKPRQSSTGAYKDARLLQAEYDNYLEEKKNKAISSGDAITVGDVLRSVKNKIFYVRPGYVYIGNSLDPAPRASVNDAASATKFLDDKGTGGDGGNGGNDDNIITVGNDEEDSDIWWLLLPVVVGGAYLLTRKGKKKNKRK